MTKLRSWRLDNGLSLRELADLTGLSVGFLSRVERDQRQLPPMTKVKVARRLGVRVADIFEVEEMAEAASS